MSFEKTLADFTGRAEHPGVADAVENLHRAQRAARDVIACATELQETLDTIATGDINGLIGLSAGNLLKAAADADRAVDRLHLLIRAGILAPAQ